MLNCGKSELKVWGQLYILLIIQNDERMLKKEQRSQ